MQPGAGSPRPTERGNVHEPEQDAADVRRVLAGDLDAFEGIVRRWQRPIVNLAYRFFRDPAVAEEMAQEAFLKAFRSLKSWRGDAAFSTWLVAVAANVCRSGLRRRAEPGAAPDAPLDLPDPRDAREALEREDREASLRRAVSALPPKYRDALILFYFQEMDVGRAAKALGLAEGTFKSRLYRGRELLRPRLAKLFSSDADAKLKEA